MDPTWGFQVTFPDPYLRVMQAYRHSNRQTDKRTNTSILITILRNPTGEGEVTRQSVPASLARMTPLALAHRRRLPRSRGVSPCTTLQPTAAIASHRATAGPVIGHMTSSTDRKYIAYCNVARDGQSHGPQRTCTENLVTFGLTVSEICVHRNSQTDRQTDAFVALQE